jgi:nicotinate-nucleotide--dimethylbenzimidazole phosphoribosyltransferase
VLDRAVERIVAVRGADTSTGTLILAAADHPVTRLGVSAFAPDVTAQVFAAAETGVALGVTAAIGAGLAVELVDAGVDPSALAAVRAGLTDTALGLNSTTLPAARHRGDLAHADAMSEGDAQRFVDAGRVIGRAAGDRGLVALGEIGIGNTTVAACLAAALTGIDAAEAVGLGSGADRAMLDRKRHIVEMAVGRWRSTSDSDAAEPIRTLAMLGGPEIAVLTGVVLGASEVGTVTVLDGLATSVAAVLAVKIEPAVADHLVAGQRSRERAHGRVLTDLGCEPLLDLRIRSGEGVGAALATGLLLQTLAMRRRTARVAY